jgi:hypothetical protein
MHAGLCCQFVLTFRVPIAAAARLLPPGIEPLRRGDWAFWQVLLGQAHGGGPVRSLALHGLCAQVMTRDVELVRGLFLTAAWEDVAAGAMGLAPVVATVGSLWHRDSCFPSRPAARESLDLPRGILTRPAGAMVQFVPLQWSTAGQAPAQATVTRARGFRAGALELATETLEVGWALYGRSVSQGQARKLILLDAHLDVSRALQRPWRGSGPGQAQRVADAAEPHAVPARPLPTPTGNVFAPVGK